MKKFIIQVVLFFITISSFAQKVGDTITLAVDTINIIGKVINEDGTPAVNAKIIAEAFGMKARYNNGYKSATSDNNGFFRLNGIKPNDTLFVYSEFGKEIIKNTGSRNLLITVRKNETIRLDYYIPELSITAPRKIKKSKIELNLIYSSDWYHPRDLYEQPTYPGGQGKFIKLIKDNVKYPESAINHNIDGNLVVEFTIDGKGIIKDIKVIRDIGYGCGDEVIKVLKSSKKWDPAMQNGKPIERKFSLEIPFKLLD